MCHRLVQNFQNRLNNVQTPLSLNQYDKGNLKFKSCVYFANWSVYDKKHFPTNIPAELYTHINYAFITIDENSGNLKFTDTWCDLEMEILTNGVKCKGNLQSFYQLKKSYRSLKLIMSIGGWGTSHLFNAIILDSKKMSNFVDSAVEYVKEYGFDGIDIDWEFCGEHQGWKYVELLRNLRSKLPSKFSLTVAAPAGLEHIKCLKIREMDQYLSFWNLMCYDFSGKAWSTKTGYHSNLFGNNGDNDLNAADVVQIYLENGVIPSKLVLGQPMYGRAFYGTVSNSIGNTFNRDIEGEDTIDYNKILSGDFDHKKVSAYSYDPQTGLFIGFDNQQSAKIKGQFVKEKALGGGMWWESSGDKTGEASLVFNFVKQLGGIAALEKSENNISYPDSKYLRNLQ
ncbi:CHT4 [Candida pseudojiufengensis]|uniref:CHT4 n=1 Tax=Candida pseudojiufengensis TaxID=497109 RepID=UPI002224193F|nr:CHT4 [Candida pseudojiufengensis]KAI5960136.1 CHT4 [Candida pseudojiufengensis]